MDILIDNPSVERDFKTILRRIQFLKSGDTVAQMKKLGLQYRINWGASIVSLRQLGKEYEPNHLLAMKLWNKQWRETMVLASLLEIPQEMPEEQMDFWTKSLPTIEIAEQLVMNLFVHSDFAYVKAMEYCVGKKHLVRYSGIQLAGRLAMVDKKAIDDMFEPFFSLFHALIKDEALTQPLVRTLTIFVNRSEDLRQQTFNFLENVQRDEEGHARQLAMVLMTDFRQSSTTKNC